ncbi:MAG: glutathione-disulfide reductase [Pseudomonadales bacterium]|nr:glutathione-disulfide reductase [Pseudomonadales bacterium]
MSTYDYDLFVIGVGSGGVRAARMSAQYGARVATAEEKYMGGTCVNVGCIPKKLFVYASHYHDDFAEAKGYGWLSHQPDFDWTTLLANKDKEILRLNGIYEGLLEGAGVTHFDGRARILDAHTISVGDKQVTTDKILIATGGWPTKQSIPGAEHIITSNEAFYLETLPKRALILGGGYIAVEFAGIYAGLGVQTELAYRGPLFLRGFDDDVRHLVQSELEKKEIALSFESTLAAVEQMPSGALRGTFEDGRVIETDVILAATGRKPAVADLGLETVNVAQRENGAIIVDDQYQTSEPNIFALGDVTDRIQLTPVAIQEAMCFASTQFAGKPQVMDYSDIATAVFCQPNIATVGLTEAEARGQYPAIRVYRSQFRPLKHTLSGSEEQSLMKIIVDDATDRVVGIHMVGAEAGEIIQGLAVAMKAGVTKAIMDQTVGIHPTAAEEFVTMRTAL